MSGPVLDTVHCGDALAWLKTLPDESAKAVVTDPPYGFGLDAWDKPPDAVAIVAEVARVLRPDGFFAFTIQSPYDLPWRLALDSTCLRFFEHIVWLKRVAGRYRHGLVSSHESLYVYGMPDAAYVETKGLYSDVKVPGLMFEAISIEGIQRHIAELHLQIKRGGKQFLPPDISKNALHQSAFRHGKASRAEEFANFTNAWSFLPENLSKRGEYADVSDHPSVKPLPLFDRLVRLLTRPDDLVVDPYCGSGTTLIAAKRAGRHYLGCDNKQAYVTLTEQRLAEPFEARMFAALGAD